MKKKLLLLVASLTVTVASFPVTAAAEQLCISEGSSGCTTFNPCYGTAQCIVGRCYPQW